MGTRADFYVGRGRGAEWLGSIAFDGYPWGQPKAILRPADEQNWRLMVADLIAGLDDGTKIEDGWPWPWNDSATTDYAYAWDDGEVWASCFGSPWFLAHGEEPEHEDADRVEFPDMTSRKNVTYGKRSGLLVFGLRGPIDD